MSTERAGLRRILDEGRVSRDGVLVVHSAFKDLSRAGWRAEGTCEALLEEMKGGTVLMPTMTWRTVTPANPVFSELETPSHTGILTEVFRTGFATHRSLHPTHSVAGCGPAAAALLSTHHLGTTPCAGNSPYGLIRDHDASILLLGVGMESCTAIHHAEEVMAEDVYVRPMAEAEAYDLVARDGTVHHVLTRRHRRLPRDFNKFIPILRDAGALAEDEVVGSAWTLFRAASLFRVAFASLAQCGDAILAGVAI